VQRIAVAAPMDEDPFAIAANGDSDGLHGRAALRRTVTRTRVEMPAPQAVGTMVAMIRSRRVGRNVEPTTATSE